MVYLSDYTPGPPDDYRAERGTVKQRWINKLSIMRNITKFLKIWNKRTFFQYNKNWKPNSIFFSLSIFCEWSEHLLLDGVSTVVAGTHVAIQWVPWSPGHKSEPPWGTLTFNFWTLTSSLVPLHHLWEMLYPPLGPPKGNAISASALQYNFSFLICPIAYGRSFFCVCFFQFQLNQWDWASCITNCKLKPIWKEM